ncbi:MAG: hypothetical protein E7576_01425 [Ruminococcaceae bacterium]|jgi:hypothetical protein|nr:hypothetical protein [Oscillospiraceae bacterium]
MTKKTRKKLAACIALLTLAAGCAALPDGQTAPDAADASVTPPAAQFIEQPIDQPAEPLPEAASEGMSEPEPEPDLPAVPLPAPLSPEDGPTAGPQSSGNDPGTLTDDSGLTCSANTLIVLLDPSVDESAAREMAQRHGTEVIYFYNILSGMAVRSDKNLTAKQLDALAAAFEAEEGVTGVSRDAVTKLDDPISPPELMG